MVQEVAGSNPVTHPIWRPVRVAARGVSVVVGSPLSAGYVVGRERYLYEGTIPGWAPRKRERLHALGARLVVVTLGARGSLASLDGHRVTAPAAPADVVDTVGAGDAFMGGLLHHLHGAGLLAPRLPGLTPELLPAALRTASLVSAATCEQRGAEPPWGVPGADRP